MTGKNITSKCSLYLSLTRTQAHTLSLGGEWRCKKILKLRSRFIQRDLKNNNQLTNISKLVSKHIVYINMISQTDFFKHCQELITVPYWRDFRFPYLHNGLFHSEWEQIMTTWRKSPTSTINPKRCHIWEVKIRTDRYLNVLYPVNKGSYQRETK